jgi:hypothetical protein
LTQKNRSKYSAIVIEIRFELLQKRVYKTSKHTFLYSVTLFPKIVPLRNNVEKSGGARDAAYENMDVRFILDL